MDILKILRGGSDNPVADTVETQFGKVIVASEVLRHLTDDFKTPWEKISDNVRQMNVTRYVFEINEASGILSSLGYGKLSVMATAIRLEAANYVRATIDGWNKAQAEDKTLEELRERVAREMCGLCGEPEKEAA